MSRIILFGGHGRVALLLTPLLVARGDEVTSIIRDPRHVADIAALGGTPVVADIENADAEGMTRLVAGHDAVVWSAGAGGGDAARTYAVDRDAAISSMTAAMRAGVRRYVMVSWIGSRADHGVNPDDGFFAYADAKWAADEHLTGTDLDWTVLGPGTLTFDEPTGLIEVDETGRGAVARGDVAAVIAQTLVEPATIDRTIRFGNGLGGAPQPIAQALR
ncbi:SDR family oxidoreductase [Microbacterium sp. NPDC055903]